MTTDAPAPAEAAIDAPGAENPGPALTPRVEVHNGREYMVDPIGALIPVEVVKPLDKLMDEVARKIAAYAIPLSAQIARFKGHSFDDVDGLMELAAQDYGTTLLGKKGNGAIRSFDDSIRIEVAVAEHIDFGPELQIAKQIVDGCLRRWAADGSVEIRAIVERAFKVDKKGKISTSQLFGLLQHDISDPEWKKGMQAIRDSIRVVGSKRYLRVYLREDGDSHRLLPLNVSAA
jgi:hypothetical protein